MKSPKPSSPRSPNDSNPLLDLALVGVGRVTSGDKAGFGTAVDMGGSGDPSEKRGSEGVAVAVEVAVEPESRKSPKSSNAEGELAGIGDGIEGDDVGKGNVAFVARLAMIEGVMSGRAFGGGMVGTADPDVAGDGGSGVVDLEGGADKRGGGANIGGRLPAAECFVTILAIGVVLPLGLDAEDPNCTEPGRPITGKVDFRVGAAGFSNTAQISSSSSFSCPFMPALTPSGAAGEAPTDLGPFGGGPNLGGESTGTGILPEIIDTGRFVKTAWSLLVVELPPNKSSNAFILSSSVSSSPTVGTSSKNEKSASVSETVWPNCELVGVRERPNRPRKRDTAD